ncbi:hypothetical protein BC830DRAFT_1117050 [Chytriomyces sp. MP71]|nr:hypothetical protein BC830DRAFT_1117050 [Chytriomyces sp. MP71]
MQLIALLLALPLFVAAEMAQVQQLGKVSQQQQQQQRVQQNGRVTNGATVQQQRTNSQGQVLNQGKTINRASGNTQVLQQGTIVRNSGSNNGGQILTPNQQQAIRQIVNANQGGLNGQTITSSNQRITFNNQGICLGQTIIVPTQILNTWGGQWSMSASQIGPIVQQILVVPVQSRTNVLQAVRGICSSNRIQMVQIIQLARACRSHITQQRVSVVQNPQRVLLNTISNVFVQRPQSVRVIQQRPIQQQQQQIVVGQRPIQQQRVIQQQPVVVVQRIVVVQPVAVRISTVCQRVGINQINQNWLTRQVLGNVVNWGCCGIQGVSGIQGLNGIQGISGIPGISRRQEKMNIAEEMANDPTMQGDVVTMLEMLMEHTQDLASANETEAKTIVSRFATAMNMTDFLVTNMCGTVVQSMLQSNMTSGEDLTAMTNCATAKDSVFISDDELNMAADAISVPVSSTMEPMPEQKAAKTASTSMMPMMTSTSTRAMPMEGEMTNTGMMMPSMSPMANSNNLKMGSAAALMIGSSLVPILFAF